jgi:hypothetical protein
LERGSSMLARCRAVLGAGAVGWCQARCVFEHFVVAQESVYPQVLAELRAGLKRSHWMWFIFPQLRELGHSAMAKRYGLGGLGDAKAYAAHPLLGARLRALGWRMQSWGRPPGSCSGRRMI